MIVRNENGVSIDFNAAVSLMDDEIREAIHADLAPCTEQEFFTAYEKAYTDKYGEAWELSKSNPQW